MKYLNRLYRYMLKLVKVFLKGIKFTISALLLPSRNRIKKQQRTLEVLSSLSYRTGELKGYLQLVANSVSELLDLDWAVVTLCREGFERVLASSIDMGIEEDYQISLHGTLTETVIRNGRCLYVEDTSIDKSYGEPPDGYLAYLGAPLRLPTGEIIGTICSFHRQPRKFTHEEMILVEIFAERAATAIDNYNLYQKQQEINLALHSEIKERQEVEQALQKSEEQLRLIAENLEPLVWMYSHDRKPIYMSPMFEKVWGIPIEQWYEDGAVCLNAVIPEDRERISIAFKKVFLDGGNYDLEYRIVRPDGSLRIIRDQAFPIIDKNGQIYRVAGIAEDITERQQEQQRTIKTMERLSEIGELAATIVHEVRNPLTTVMMGLDFFHRMELSENARKRLTLALDEAERLKRLLNEILLYAKHEVIQVIPIDMNELTLELIKNISSTQVAIGKQIGFEAMPEPLIIFGDKDKLTQVLINLLQNACEAVPEGEKISVSFSSLISSRQICMQVQNRGTPIPSELLPNLTKPFITTKPSGNGLGLAIVKKIVEAHGGILEIESSPIAGTIVSVLLPIAT
ncbi:two-component sensor histidine kinase [Pseudanabaena sp. lw0831]|uniref:ATP-binding protein n=1 Tax=Pseudanabaena sp. lw0831 TaxID=1357935 RepID=UPI001915D024|nr:ATP-binding protein [Pseudanabaena sp. lw0831]GBO55398.1 two-component sensor histidine kinase [Pseudanabaena sp. lw0831]